MIKALLLIVKPIAAWEGIVKARRSVRFIYLAFLLPLLLITALGEGYGLVNWGKWQGELHHLRRFSVKEAVVVEAGQLLLSMLVVFTGTHMIKSVGETFHGRHTYTQAFTLVAYTLSPLFLLRLLDAGSEVSPWMSWSIGIILSVAVLYHGVPRTMAPDPAHGFALYFMSALLLMLITGLVRLVTASYLQGKFGKLQVIVSDIAARLPF